MRACGERTASNGLMELRTMGRNSLGELSDHVQRILVARVFPSFAEAVDGGGRA